MEEKRQLIDKVSYRIQKFGKQEKAGGVVLGISVIAALFFANSPWREQYFHFFEHKFGFIIDAIPIFEYSIRHWINDGLMAIFFFVVGLELKREFVAGELADIRKSLLPVGAAIGGMIMPAVIYFLLNQTGEVSNGWGIPMATDIAFALAVLYLLGDRIPSSLKVFLTALAIVDDLGAVIVIAIFYSLQLSFFHLGIGLACAFVMFLGNKIGIRDFIFYALLGILGVWTFFLLSGVHATIAAVIAAFIIPCDVKITESVYIKRIQHFLVKINGEKINDEQAMLTDGQLGLLEKVKRDTNKAIPPLQRLESSIHPFVTYVILPVFAFANAGVSLDFELGQLFSTNVTLGVSLGLFVGKILGIVGFTLLMIKLKIAPKPDGMTFYNLFGIGLLGAIGFTMSMFVTSLAFVNPDYMIQAKIGIFMASILGGITGYIVLSRSCSKPSVRQ